MKDEYDFTKARKNPYAKKLSLIHIASCFTERTVFVVNPSTFCIRKRTSFPSSVGPNLYSR